MRYRSFTILSGVIAALALAQGPAQAIELLGNNIGVNLGGGGKPNISANIGGTTAAVKATTGGASTANVTANVNNGSGSALPNSLSGSGNFDLDDVTNGGRVTVDLNGDGVIDEDDTLLARLDLNGDGVLDLLDDANDDGVLNSADLDVAAMFGEDSAEGTVDLGIGDGPGGIGSFRIGGLPAGEVDLDDATNPIGVDDLQLPPIDISGIGIDVLPPPDLGPGPGPGPTPGPGPGGVGFNPGPVPGVDSEERIDITDTLRNLNDVDLRKFKVKCVDVMANPNAFSATTVEICKTLASL
jgi:hypothetical protein